MILASQDADLATLSAFLLKHWICSVPAYIQERFHLVLAVTNDEELVSGNVEIHKLANFFDSQSMGDTHPALGKDGSLLKLEHTILAIP